MALIYKSYTPKGVGEIMDHLTYIMFSGPAFADPRFVGRDLPTAFHELNEGLGLIRDKLGEERYAQLIDLSNQVRAHYEADPENKTDDTVKGRELIVVMENILKQKV
ncbi:MAG: hypothetical protein WAU68_17515 [Vitreimonas sp.]